MTYRYYTDEFMYECRTYEEFAHIAELDRRGLLEPAPSKPQLKEPTGLLENLLARA